MAIFTLIFNPGGITGGGGGRGGDRQNYVEAQGTSSITSAVYGGSLTSTDWFYLVELELNLEQLSFNQGH